MKVKATIHQSRLQRFESSYLLFIQNMLLFNKIRLTDIPPVLRTMDVSIYLTALRISRGISRQRYQEDLDVMRSDFLKLAPEKRKQWSHYYYDSVRYIDNSSS